MADKNSIKFSNNWMLSSDFGDSDASEPVNYEGADVQGAGRQVSEDGSLGTQEDD